MNTKHRNILIINGDREYSIVKCAHLLTKHSVVWVSDKLTNQDNCIPFKKARTQLGQENTAIVFDAIDHFDANALGAIAGTLVGGGVLILLLPATTEHHQNPRFLKRLNQLAIKHGIAIQNDTTAIFEAPCPTHNHTRISLSDDQRTAIDCIVNVAKGRRNRPLVMTADRGRGKSSALGMAALALSEQGLDNILVTAPAKAMVQPLFEHASNANNLTFIAPDELDLTRPKADLLIIDEAGAIPVPLLSRLLQHYSRIVFSTTILGYEGNGRGFAIRFQEHLDQYTPNWRSTTLNTPIRWGANDPLESFLNALLLLGTEASASNDQQTDSPATYRQINAEQLASDEDLLRQVFGLLVIAHYQTRPSDLLQLLDSEQLSIHTLMQDKTVVAVTVVSHEGGLDAELTQQIFEGKRRPQGHLVPQVLTYQSGIMDAACLTTDRIMRIAVHPEHQDRGIGTHMLSEVCQRSKADYLSTSFGLSARLLNFWSQSGFAPAHIGLKREASSGYHSAVFVRPTPQNEKSQAIYTQAAEHFSRNFVALLADNLKNFKPSLVLSLLNKTQLSFNVSLSQAEQRDIMRFANGQCGYDLVMASLLRWLPSALAAHSEKLELNTAELLVMRVLQHHDWATCCQALSITGKQFALQQMQQAVATLAGLLASTDCPSKASFAK